MPSQERGRGELLKFVMSKTVSDARFTCSHGQGGYGRLPHVFDWFTHPVGLPDTRYGRPEIRLITQHHAQQIPTGCKTTRKVFYGLEVNLGFLRDLESACCVYSYM